MQVRLSFGPFVLDPFDRLLLREGQTVELGGRYFDALLLLAGEQGRLITKDRFHQEVWRGIPVTDEALTQCIRTLRRQLGDDAAAPRYIETVPKHGYRFVAPVERLETLRDATPSAPQLPAARPAPPIAATTPGPLPLALAAGGGGAIAGVAGGLLYGLGASSSVGGATSLFLVMLAVCVGVGGIGGLGVGAGIAAAHRLIGRTDWRLAVGGAIGGMVIGALVKLIGLDAFALLFGRRPFDMTGGGEGALLGLAIGTAAWVALSRRQSPRRAAAIGALAGLVAGLLLALGGQPLMGGSLVFLTSTLPIPNVSLDPIGRMLGEPKFEYRSLFVTTLVEAPLFCAAVTAALAFARRLMQEPAS